MYRYLFIITILLWVTCYKANGQANLQGRVYELQTRIHLQSIRVTNLNTKQFAITDTAGIFFIYAKPGDLLAFRGYSYKPDTISIVNKNHLEIFLEPVSNLLNEVKVTTPDVKTGTMKDPSLTGAPLVYQRDANGNYKGGVALRFGYGKDKKAIHNKQLSDEEAADYEIDNAFNEKALSKTIPLKGQELKDFILMYRPQIKVFKAPGFNLTIYINDCYKKYMALPVDKRKPDQLKL
ncbi:hypothetical protein [Mucilaginibacter gracilis]|nr:hypothetical protein [Mucilaginibacter gracilis]